MLLLLFFLPKLIWGGDGCEGSLHHCTCFKTCFLVCQNLVFRDFILLAFSLGSLTWAEPGMGPATCACRCWFEVPMASGLQLPSL